MKTCDLHCHSVFSDGTMTPKEILDLADEINLGAVALTDHNTSRGLRSFVKESNSHKVIAVPGCEFSTDFFGTELHIVGLFMPNDTWYDIESYVGLMRERKVASNYQLIDRLNKAGYSITFEEVAASTEADTFNRAHVAAVLMKKGYVESVSVAFDTILSEGAGFYIPAKRLDALGTVRFIKDCRGAAVLAHPFLNLDENGLVNFLVRAKSVGLDGVETHYSKFDKATTKKAEEIAEELGLLQSGGSDFHGSNKPDISLGTGMGDLCVPFEFYEALSLRAE